MVTNSTTACARVNGNPGKMMPLVAVRYLVIHRTSLDHYDARANPNPVDNIDLSGIQLAEAFANKGLGTGGRIPYHFLVRADSKVEQMLPLTQRGAHAIGYNYRSIGIACVGDYRYQPPTPEVWDQLVRLVAALLPLNGGLMLAGHSDLQGATGDTGKVCPGKHLPIGELAEQVVGLLGKDWKSLPGDYVISSLTDAGYTV